MDPGPGPIVAFTDTYLPTVNGVSYTIQTWRDRWQARGGRMDVVYPGADGYDPDPGEFPVRSLPFPFYDGFRLGVPQVPAQVRDAAVVHAHTPFALGVAALRLVRRTDRPFVVSYHTPTHEYADYLAPVSRGPMDRSIAAASRRYERWFLGHADAVVVPSESTREHVRDALSLSCDVYVLPNGVDGERFEPVDTTAFRARYDLEGPLVGYTGRHGYEKCLDEFVEAAVGLDATVVFGGDGPARADLEAAARERDVDARFLGFLDRDELPALYSALDVFAFPSPVETQGIVALEAMACGTPVVAVDAGALADTVDHGVTGYRYDRGDVEGFRAAIERTLDERERLRENCLARRESMSVERAVDDLAAVYDRVVG